MLLALIKDLALVGIVLLLVAWGTGSNNDYLAIVAGLLGAFAWGLCAYGLLAVETMDTTGTHSEPGLALFAAAAAVATLTPALVNPFDAAGDAAESNEPLERV